MTKATPPSRSGTRILLVGAAIVLAAVIVMALGALGSRWGWWHFRTGFMLLRWASYAALGGALVAIVGGLAHRSRRAQAVVIAGLVALAAVGSVAMPWWWRRTAASVPRIHDITTDTGNPPEFVYLRDRRPGARNPPEYPGEEVAALQRAGYPDLGPITIDLPAARTIERSVEIARELGWEVAHSDTSAGRMEATDRTRWFGFYDDVVVRVTPTEGGSRIDVRSKSRVGGSDVGTNARRIRAFLSRLQRIQPAS